MIVFFFSFQLLSLLIHTISITQQSVEYVFHTFGNMAMSMCIVYTRNTCTKYN